MHSILPFRRVGLVLLWKERVTPAKSRKLTQEVPRLDVQMRQHAGTRHAGRKAGRQAEVAKSL